MSSQSPDIINRSEISFSISESRRKFLVRGGATLAGLAATYTVFEGRRTHTDDDYKKAPPENTERMRRFDKSQWRKFWGGTGVAILSGGLAGLVKLRTISEIENETPPQDAQLPSEAIILYQSPTTHT